MADAQRTGQTSGRTESKDAGLLDQILNNVSSDRAVARDILAEFVDQVVRDEPVVTAAHKNTERLIKAHIGRLDALISKQLNEILHAEPFQRLEASWRGLHLLVHESETGTQLKVKVLNASKADLLRDFERASEFDQSAVFEKVYSDEYGQLGGEPFGVLVGDYEFGNTSQDLTLLETMSNVASAAHAPFIAAASPQMFGLDSFTNLSDPRDISKIFEGKDYVKWRSFRESDHARYVGLCLPHVLLREPYGPDTKPVEAFGFQEDVDGAVHDKYLWGNAAYAFATRLTESFANYGWCTSIRGVEAGGAVQGLPTHTFKTDRGDVTQKCPTEVAITERRELELAEAGFISLVHSKGSDRAVFFSAQSANKPKKYNTAEATGNARLSAQLQYTFATSRFAHYMKTMMRDKVGSFMSRKDAQDFLQNWIAGYVLDDDTADPKWKAERPLRAAQISVEDVPGQPGVYRAVALLQPHYQLDEINISLRLVADLPASKA